MLKTELERARKNEPLPALDTHRYQLPAPTSTPGSDEEWKAALDNARAQLQHQRLRWVTSLVPRFHILIAAPSQTNLALLQTYGPNAYRINNYLLEATTKQVEKASEDLKQLTVDVNRERKNDQVRASAIVSNGTPLMLDAIGTTWKAVDLARDAVDGAYLEHPSDRTGQHCA